MKKTATEYLFEQLWDIPKHKFAWLHYLAEAKEMEKSNLLWYGAKCFMLGLSSAIVVILILKFI